MYYVQYVTIFLKKWISVDFSEIRSNPDTAPQFVTARCDLTSRIMEIEALYYRVFIFTDFSRALEEGGAIPIFVCIQLECIGQI
jgi:hypothetical protein